MRRILERLSRSAIKQNNTMAVSAMPLLQSVIINYPFFFSTAYKRSHTEEQKILYKKPWYLNLENAYSHMKYAVALQHRDTELRNAATLGHGFKQAAIAFTNNDDSTWVNRLNHFKSLIQKRKKSNRTHRS